MYLPFFRSYVQAGFPSPADDYLENPIDLNELLIKRPTATFLVRARGESMKDDGIFEGSLLVVDRSLNIRNGLLCIASINGDFTVKRFFDRGSYIELLPANSKFKPLRIKTTDDFEIWGVVRAVINQTL